MLKHILKVKGIILDYVLPQFIDESRKVGLIATMLHSTDLESLKENLQNWKQTEDEDEHAIADMVAHLYVVGTAMVL